MPETATTSPDVIDAEAAPTPEPAEAPKEVRPAAPSAPDDLRAQETRRRTEVHSGLQSFLRIKDSAVLADPEIIDATKDWTEGYGLNEQNLAETLKYFELTKEIISQKFPPEQRIEIACALAELVAEGTFDAETLQALAGRVVYGGKSGTMDNVAEYQADRLVMKVYDEMFEDIDGVPQNIVHILKHEIAHGLSHHGEVGGDEQTQEQIKNMIGNADGLKSRETYRSINAIDKYLAVQNKEDATAEEIQQMQKWLAEELRAEKVAAYLESNGNFGSFIEAQLKVMPWENVKQLFESGDNESQNQWLAENKVIFDQIAGQMKDKEAVKTKIMASTEEARAELEGYSDDELEEYLAGGYGEPAIPDNSKTANGRAGGKGGGWISSLLQLADAFDKEISGTVPVNELVRDK